MSVSLGEMVGCSRTAQYEVRHEDLVTTYRKEHPEIEMVDCLATSKLQLWAAKTCMLTLGGFSMGQEYLIKHLDLAVLGSMVTIEVKCAWWGGKRVTRWEMKASTEFGPLASGHLIMRTADLRAVESLIRRKLDTLAASGPAPLPTRSELPDWYRAESDREIQALKALARGNPCCRDTNKPARDLSS